MAYTKPCDTWNLWPGLDTIAWPVNLYLAVHGRSINSPTSDARIACAYGRFNQFNFEELSHMSSELASNHHFQAFYSQSELPECSFDIFQNMYIQIKLCKWTTYIKIKLYTNVKKSSNSSLQEVVNWFKAKYRYLPWIHNAN